MWSWLKSYGPITLSVLSIAVMVGVYKNTVDDLKERVAKLETELSVTQNTVDPRLAECARLAKVAYGDGTRTSMDNRTDLLMLRLGCQNATP